MVVSVFKKNLGEFSGIQHETDRAVIAPWNFRLDESALQVFFQPLGGAEVIDAPPDISLARAILVAPPGVFSP
jgi:hypothetical protein